MPTHRSVIDYALAKRATLADLFAGRLSPLDVCDAHPICCAPPKYHGETATTDCPVCKREPLIHVTYVYGDELKEAAGQVRPTIELARMAREYADLTVYVVEVCRSCGWNHLDISYQIGTNGTRPRRVRRSEQQSSEAEAEAGAEP